MIHKRVLLFSLLVCFLFCISDVYVFLYDETQRECLNEFKFIFAQLND